MGNSSSSPQMVNSFLRPIQHMLKQWDLKVSDRTIKGFLEDIDQAAPWFRASGDVNLPYWEKLGQDLTEAKGRGELQPGTLPLWRMICYCLKDGKCVDILRKGRRALSAHQDNMSESDSKEKGNLKEERPKSSKASSKLHTKVEKEKEIDQGKTEKETDQGKSKQKPSGLYLVLDEFKQKPSGLYLVLDEFKQKPSGLYLVLDEFADIILSDSAEDELDSEEEEDLEEAAAAYEQERYSPENTKPPPYYPPKAKLKGISSASVASNSLYIKPCVWGQLATAFPVFEDPTMHNRFHEAALVPTRREYPQVRIIHYMDDILLATPSQVMLDKAYAHTVQALEKKGLYIAPEKVQKDSIDHKGDRRLSHIKENGELFNATLPEAAVCVQPPFVFLLTNATPIDNLVDCFKDLCLLAECWNGTWTLAVIVKVPTFVPILVEADSKTFPILTLLRERRDFGITAAIVAAIVLSAASAVTATVAMTNQIQTAQIVNTVVEQTSAVMETQHRINKHLISDGLGMPHASEEDIWKILKTQHIYPGKKHRIFGEPRKLMTDRVFGEAEVPGVPAGGRQGSCML
ncbi:hypothetical protein STEG23_003186 [Scotinomys teguina]